MLWLILTLLTALSESVSNALGKKGAQKVDVLSAAWAQRFFALFILVPLVIVTNSFMPVNSTFWVALLSSAILNTINSIIFFKAVKDSPLSLTLPIVNFTPVFLLITSPIMLGEFPKPLGLLGILTTVVGSYILNLSQKVHGPLEPIFSIFKERGSRLMLLVAFIWSLTSNIQKISVQNSNPILTAFLEGSIILILLTIILIFQKISFQKIFTNSGLLAPVGITSGLSAIFQMTAISQTIVPNVLAVKRTSTIFGTIWGKLFFKEDKIKERLAGVVIMVLGVILIVLS